MMRLYGDRIPSASLSRKNYEQSRAVACLHKMFTIPL